MYIVPHCMFKIMQLHRNIVFLALLPQIFQHFFCFRNLEPESGFLDLSPKVQNYEKSV